MKVLSVVCARAGSKGLKNKCVTRIADKMVIEYSIEYSLSLGKDALTVVSTDIESIIEYCKVRGIKYINRDQKICKDETRIDDVLADAIEKYGNDSKYCSLVYGNIPTRYPGIFHDGLKILEADKEYDAAISMQNVGKFHPEWMFEYNEKVVPRVKESHYRRQDLAQKMIHDGHTLIFDSEKFYKRFKGLMAYDREYRYSVYGDRIKPLVNSETIVDIDTKKDMELAKAVLASRLDKEPSFESR